MRRPLTVMVAEARSALSLYPHQTALDPGGWQVRARFPSGGSGAVVDDLNSKEVAEAWIRRLADAVVEQDLPDGPGEE